jgi:serine-type D-Ala-D-Ala carboxypeptidase/endopeptidase (penicillin-binding protein 4)
MKFKPFIISSILLVLFSSWSKNISDKTFIDEINHFTKDSGMDTSSWSLSIFSVKTSTELYSYNSKTSLIPASTLKALTTATALSILGSDYQYVTSLFYNGSIDNAGTLHGNLIIKGSGDPSFGASRMNDSLSIDNVFLFYYNAIKSLGIKKIRGSVIADTSVFDSIMVSPKWLWEDLGNYFGAGTNGLSVNENEYSVFFRAASSIGQETTVVRTSPFIHDMILHNSVTTAERGTGDNVYIFGIPYSDNRWLTGTIPLGANEFEVRGSMSDPAKYFSTAFHRYLNSKNIEITQNPEVINFSSKKSINYMNVRKIADWVSPKLKDIAERTNIASVNTYAESLLKTISVNQTKTGTSKDGIKIMLDYWEKKGVNIKGIKLYDGSGLSPSNRITTQALAHALAIIANEPTFDDFRKGLPVAGQSGSLRNGFSGTASENILTAKSGFLENVRAFAGYTTTKNGQLVAFSLIVNNYDGTQAVLRNKMNRLMDAITNMEY